MLPALARLLITMHTKTAVPCVSYVDLLSGTVVEGRQLGLITESGYTRRAERAQLNSPRSKRKRVEEWWWGEKGRP